MVGTEGRQIALPDPPAGKYWIDNIVGNCVVDNITYEGLVGDDTDTHDALLPFYERVFEFCDVGRPK